MATFALMEGASAAGEALIVEALGRRNKFDRFLGALGFEPL
jgi:hypothetical protein